MPVNVSPPLSNILMNLDVRQLREILIEIISWDATGKDIFDTDYLFQDPIKVRGDYTKYDVKLSASSRWSFGPNFEWDGIETIGKLHPYLLPRALSGFSKIVPL